MMSFGVFLQIFANVVFTVALFVVFARLRRPAKDDPRLSKGLQLLSSKIAVLEDLSDRTETQVQQMLVLLDQKSRELQAKIGLAEQQVGLVRQSMQQSLEVAQIFQDKIPHSEIIERQNSVKYIKAARMAHAGVSVADIAREVDLPVGEIEFIAKVNQENLTFREEELPAWAREPEAASAPASTTIAHQNLAASLTPQPSERMPVPASAELSAGEKGELIDQLNKLQFEMKNLDLELAHRSARNVLPDTTQAFSRPKVESTSLERLGQEFRRAVEQAEEAERSGDRRSFAETFAESFAKFENQVSEMGTVAASKSASAQPVAQAAPQAATQKLELPPAVSTSTTPVAPTTAPVVPAPQANPELEAARAAAAALRTPDAISKADINQVTKTIRRVEFPRI